MSYDYPVINADVVVVGGGSAGVMAGIRAKEVAPDQEVIVLKRVRPNTPAASPGPWMPSTSWPCPEWLRRSCTWSPTAACEGIMDERLTTAWPSAVGR